MTPPREIALGAARVRVFSIGDLRADLGKWWALSPAEIAAAPDPALFAAALAVPVQCVHIALPETTILVDAGRYDPSDPDFRIPEYTPPPDLLTQLAAAGLAAEQVQHVVLTHAHFDHYLGVTHQGLPSFPRARYYLGAADYGPARRRPGFEETLGVLHRLSVLELVTGSLELAPGASLLPAPGETPGHQILRLASQGQTLYCLGDLYHHAVEFARPEWNVYWADAVANARSRQALVEAARAEKALLIPAHIQPGRLSEQGYAFLSFDATEPPGSGPC